MALYGAIPASEAPAQVRAGVCVCGYEASLNLELPTAAPLLARRFSRSGRSSLGAVLTTAGDARARAPEEEAACGTLMRQIYRL